MADWTVRACSGIKEESRGIGTISLRENDVESFAEGVCRRVGVGLRT